MKSVVVFLLLAAFAPCRAAPLCTHDSAELRTNLAMALASNANDTIAIVRGTYDTGGSTFSYAAPNATSGNLTIEGGFNSDCSTQIKNPALTILNGDSTSTVLLLTGSAAMSVRYLTIQHGYGNPGGGGMFLTSVSGPVIIDYNIFRDNSGYNFVGVGANITSASSTQALRFDGNLLVRNIASASDGAGDVGNAGMGNTYVTNNTVSDNQAGSGQVGGLFVSANYNAGSVAADISNNIFWGNDNFGLGVIGAPTLVNNDYGMISGTPGAGSSGNLQVNPQFVGGGDYRLSASSPLLAQGDLTPAGNLPTIDLEGHARSFNGTVDMGAYERGDKIFADGLDR